MNCFIDIQGIQEINLYPIEIKINLVNNEYFHMINSFLYLIICENFENQNMQLTDDQIKEEVCYWYAMKLINSLKE